MDQPAPFRPTPASSRFSLWGPVLLYCLLIFGLSSVSNVGRLPGGMTDKEGHTLLYAGLGVLVSRAVARAVPRWWPLVVVLFAGVYGVSDEVHQLFVPGRQFEVADMVADAVGGAVGAVAFCLWGIIARTTWARSR